jgi:hypothetical protein
MTVELVINGQDVAPLLSRPPRISDDLEAVCRTLDFTLYAAEALTNYLGQPVELYLDGKRWYFGFLEVRGWEARGQVTYRVYDPLYFLRKNPDDYYFNGQTANQIAEKVLKNIGVARGKIASTGVVLPPQLYKRAEGDKVIIDALVKTVRGGGKKFWLRFDPDESGFGATIFERKVPAHIWAFQRGVNLTDARYTESLEEMYNVVKLVNRETGKTVKKFDQEFINRFAARTRFEEVDKDAAATMDKDAAAMLKEGAKVKTSISLEGINADLVMPQFYSGDVIYVEEDFTNVWGAHHIRRVEQTVVSSKVILLTMDVEDAPGVPPIQFEDAEKEATKTGKGVSENPVYSEEMKALIEKYGLEK